MSSPIEDSYIVDMTPRSTERFELPGSEDGEFFVVACQFNTTGDALFTAGAREGDGSSLVAALHAGLCDFCLPGKTKDGQPCKLTHSTFASNHKVYEQLVSAPATRNFALECVGKLNPSIFRQMTEEEQAAVQGQLAAEREELAAVREVVGEDDVPLDPSGCAGAPACSSEEKTDTTPACSTPSNALS